jgi:hypothetical protein
VPFEKGRLIPDLKLARSFVIAYSHDVRTSVLARKKLENLVACVCLYIAYYNFCWMHGSLPGTPAMEAGLAGHPWTLEELFDGLQ